MKNILAKCTTALVLTSSVALAQTLTPEDVQDLDPQTGIGCIKKKPISEKANYYHLCQSNKSGEVAWNAALYRSKIACSTDELSVYFNLPPSLPTENGIFSAQVEVSCGEEE